MLKIKSKKKTSKDSTQSKPQIAAKKQAPKPEWDSTHTDLNRYKVTQAELVQKKVALKSKHQFEAKELWLKRQEKLRKGILDEETQSVMDTCLSTKRQPERNRRNLTSFIKDENYDNREYLEAPPDEDESEEHLSLMDLQHDNEPKENIQPQKKASEIEKRKSKVENDADTGGDVMSKVNQSLKNARELIGKIERYPSITKSNDLEKALNVLQNSQKENKPRTSSIPKAKQTKANVPTKDPLRRSQPSQVATSSSTDRKIDIFNTKSDNSPKLFFGEGPKHSNYEPEEKEDQEDISKYFKSLNQIEDTIKFLEDNIIGQTERESEVQIKDDKTYESMDFKKSEYEKISPIKNLSSKGNDYSRDIFSQKDYLKPKEDHLDLFDLKPEKLEQSHQEPDHKDHDKELTHDDEQISFDLTMRSEHPEIFEQKHNYLYDDDFNDLHHPNNIAETLKRPQPTPYQESQASFPQVILDHKQPLKERSVNEQAKTLKPNPSLAQKIVAVDDDEDEDLNIERIKNMLQATKNEIEKMNTSHMSTYNTSYKNTLGAIEKENISDNLESQFQESFGSKSNHFSVKASEPIRTEVPIQSKKAFNPVAENQRRVLGEINDNKYNAFDDDIPAPEPLNIKKHQANYVPVNNNEDNSLSIRSFRRK